MANEISFDITDVDAKVEQFTCTPQKFNPKYSAQDSSKRVSTSSHHHRQSSNLTEATQLQTLIKSSFDLDCSVIGYSPIQESFGFQHSKCVS